MGRVWSLPKEPSRKVLRYEEAKEVKPFLGGCLLEMLSAKCFPPPCCGMLWHLFTSPCGVELSLLLIPPRALTSLLANSSKLSPCHPPSFLCSPLLLILFLSPSHLIFCGFTSWMVSERLESQNCLEIHFFRDCFQFMYSNCSHGLSELLFSNWYTKTGILKVCGRHLHGM